MGIRKNIRLATEADTVALLEIYAPYVRDTAVTFEYVVPSVADFRKRIVETLAKYPWLVCEIGCEIAGYAYASPYHERAAYGWSADVSIYVHPDYHRQKVGKALYGALLQLLKYQGFCTVYACITSSNAISMRFHETFHFKPVGTFHNAGSKLGQWHDVTWLERPLGACPAVPKPPKTIGEIKDTPAFEAIIANAVQIIAE